MNGRAVTMMLHFVATINHAGVTVSFGWFEMSLIKSELPNKSLLQQDYEELKPQSIEDSNALATPFIT
ncbi:hypothetical protein CEXT_447391 [Caerostris extrusa]|uniref:Uncharacterized protein n=1 Tax=Caerostris extrusa TaxID=172846 RepID=A0AAV4V5S1_CAEEX|nr:hypothetical protein CEXT_447391 [Caerostris extrusa]